MILEVGKAGKARFVRFVKKTNIFECGDNGMVLEREKNFITLYVTNAACSVIYAKIPLGGNEILKTNKFVGIAYSENIMLLDGGDIMVVVDYAEKKVAVNKPEIQVVGKKDWEGDVRMPWKPGFDAMFGLAAPMKEMDLEAAEEFWKWFLYNELEIVEKVSAGGSEAQHIVSRISSKLCPVFPYENPKDVEFQLGCNGDVKEFFMYHFNKEQMKQDAERLGEMMPEELKESWSYLTEA